MNNKMQFGGSRLKKRILMNGGININSIENRSYGRRHIRKLK